MPNRSFSHLSLEDRVRIDEMLKRHESIRSIARSLGVSPSTILREIRNHTVVTKSKQNDCLNRKDCYMQNLCEKHCKSKLCKNCAIPCRKRCSDYVQAHCEDLCQAPYLCNGCRKYWNCTYEKRIYQPKEAQKAYKTMLSDRRSGYDLTGEELMKIDEIVSPLLKQGQSPYHIMQTAGKDLPISETTLRRLINDCELTARNIDLRSTVSRRVKPRKHKKPDEKISISKIGHLYNDYHEYINNHDIPTVQMDCVEGKKEDRAVLLTLHFPEIHMQLAFILNEHTSACVVNALNMIEEALGAALFREVFPLILTDNGHEFVDIEGMERSISGGTRTKIFFCDPNRSDEKGACENNHKFIRCMIPKGTSLEPYCQADITLMMNHINSYKRKSLHGKSPYEIAKVFLPEDFFILLGLEEIPAEQICLDSKLFQH